MSCLLERLLHRSSRRGTVKSLLFSVPRVSAPLKHPERPARSPACEMPLALYQASNSSPRMSALSRNDLCEAMGVIEAYLAVKTDHEIKALVRRVGRMVPSDYAIA